MHPHVCQLKDIQLQDWAWIEAQDIEMDYEPEEQGMRVAEAGA
jgi:hypothetical protein